MALTLYGNGQSVVQIVQGVYTGATTVTPGSFTFTDLVSATITLKNPNNNVLVTASLNYWSNNYCAARLIQSINGGSYTVCPNSISRSSFGGTHMGGAYNNGNGPGGHGASADGFSMLITPGAGTTTFSVKAQAAPNSGGTIYINQSATADMGSGPCILTLMEISTS